MADAPGIRRAAQRRHGFGFEVTAEQRLLLRAALLQGEPALAAWEQWQGSVALDALDTGSLRMLPLLYRNLVDHGVEPDRRLRAAHQQSWYRNMTLMSTAGAALGLLAEHGVETMIVKGVALATWPYPDLASRPAGDIDVIIPAPAGPLAVQVLAEAGWRWHPDENGRTHRELTLVDERGQGLDLHWQITERRRAYRWEADCWGRRQPLTVGGASTSRLEVTDELLLSMIHGLAHNSQPSFRWLADAALLIRTGPVDWQRFVASAETAGAVLPATRGVQRLGEVLDVVVPAEVHAALAGASTTMQDRFRWAYGHLPETYRVPTLAGYVDFADAYGHVPTPVGYARYLFDEWDAPDSRAVVDRLRRKVRNRGRHRERT